MEDTLNPNKHFCAILHNETPLSQVKEYYHAYKNQIEESTIDLLMALNCFHPEPTDKVMWLFDLLLSDCSETKEMNKILRVCHCYASVDMFQKFYGWCQENDVPDIEKHITPTKASSVEVLEWWKDTFAPTFYEHSFSSYVPSVEVLKWWFKSSYNLVIKPEALLRNFVHDMERLRIFHTRVRLPPRIIYSAIIDPNNTNTLQDLEWLYQEYSDYFPEILSNKYSAGYAVDVLSHQGKWQFIDFFVKNDIPFMYTSFAIDEIVSLECAEFWSKSGLELKHTVKGFYKTLFNEDIGLAKWWLDNGLSHKECYDVDALSDNLRVDVIQLLIDQGIEIKYTERAMHFRQIHDDHNVVENVRKAAMWWLNSGLELKYDHEFLETCIQHGLVDIFDIMLKRDLPFPADDVDFNNIYILNPEGIEDIIKKVVIWWCSHGFVVTRKDKSEPLNLEEEPEYEESVEESDQDSEEEPEKKETKKEDNVIESDSDDERDFIGDINVHRIISNMKFQIEIPRS